MLDQETTTLLRNQENSMTKKYKHHRTQETVNFFAQRGWDVNTVTYCKTRDITKAGTQKHVVRLRNENFKVGNDYMEILITNSYNGQTCFVLNLGIYRLVCSNGLVIGDDLFEAKIKHIGQDFEEKLENAYEQLVAKTDEIKESIFAIKNKTMTPKQKYKFASRCIRKGKDVKGKVIDFRKVLEPLREADKGDSAWQVFNVVQEKLTTKGIDLVLPEKKEKGKRPQQKLRGIGVHQLVEVNKFMYNEINKLAA